LSYRAQIGGTDRIPKKLNRKDLEDREENIYCGLRGYRFCQIMCWIPSLMRVTFQSAK
jgi:hypothetical protein